MQGILDEARARGFRLAHVAANDRGVYLFTDGPRGHRVELATPPKDFGKPAMSRSRRSTSLRCP
jgi:hypothetical protein